MNYIDERRIAKVTDADGSELECEISVYLTPDMAHAEVKLREVVLAGVYDGIKGHGVHFFNARDYATFLVHFRKDQESLDWTEIEAKCRESYDSGETTSAIQPVSDRSDEG